MQGFKDFLNESKAPKSVILKTKKSIIENVEIMKYGRKGAYGVLVFTSKDDKLDFLKENGFSMDRNTNNPYRTYEDKKQMLVDLKDIFGITKDSKLDKFLEETINEVIKTNYKQFERETKLRKDRGPLSVKDINVYFLKDDSSIVFEKDTIKHYDKEYKFQQEFEDVESAIEFAKTLI